MPNTANYSFPTPADTDLVKNGADAIRDLGDAVDTAMNTALGTKKSGLVLLNTTSFSAVATQSFNNVFSAAYENYMIYMRVDGSTTDNNFAFRYRVGGVDNSTASSYLSQSISGNSTSVSGVRETTSYGVLGEVNNAGTLWTNVHISSPFLTVKTLLVATTINKEDPRLRTSAVLHNQSTSYDGFTIYPLSSGTITGKVAIYGANF